MRFLSLCRSDKSICAPPGLSAVAGALPAGLAVRPLAHPTSFRTFVVVSAETARAIFAARLIDLLRAEMRVKTGGFSVLQGRLNEKR